MSLQYIQGDLFKLYKETGNPAATKHIPHVCNDIGGWGSGFVVAVSKQWPMSKKMGSPEYVYRKTFDQQYYWEMQKDPDITPKECLDFSETFRKKYGHYPISIFEMKKNDNYNPKWFDLGEVVQCNIEDDDWQTRVHNMIAQHETIRTVKKPIRYASLAQCMIKVKNQIKLINELEDDNGEIHAPKFGSALARGDWNIIEQFIKEVWVDEGIPVYIYEL